MQPGPLRGAPSPLPGDEDVAVAVLPDEERQEHPAGLDRVGKLAEMHLVEMAAGLPRRGTDLLDSDGQDTPPLGLRNARDERSESAAERCPFDRLLHRLDPPVTRCEVRGGRRYVAEVFARKGAAEACRAISSCASAR